MRGGGSMQDARHREGKFRNDRLKRRAVLGHHLVFTAHAANRCGQRGAAGVLKLLARFYQRLRADHAQSAHFLNLLFFIGDDPMAADQLRRHRTDVAYGDGVGKNIARNRLVRLLGDVLDLRRDADFWFFG